MTDEDSGLTIARLNEFDLFDSDRRAQSVAEPNRQPLRFDFAAVHHTLKDRKRLGSRTYRKTRRNSDTREPGHQVNCENLSERKGSPAAKTAWLA